MKIVYVFGYPLGIGGHFKSGLAMAKRMRQLGHQVTVFAGTGSAAQMQQAYEAIGSQVIQIPALARQQEIPLTDGADEITAFAHNNQSDIIHPQDFYAIGPAYQAAIRLGLPMVCTEAGGYSRHHRPPPRVPVVVFSTEQIEEYEKEFGTPKSRLHLIRARIDLEEYHRELVRAEFVERLKLPDASIRIVIASRLEISRKTIIEALLQCSQAASQHNLNAHIVIAGDGSARSEFEAMARNAKDAAGTRLHFIGPVVALADIRQLYNWADIVIGSGRGILEAMACGKPVIVCGERGEAEVITGENIDEVAHHNFSGRHFRYRSEPKPLLSEAVLNLADDAARRQQLATFSEDYIATQMDVSVGVSQLLAVYQASLGHRSTRLDSARWYTRLGWYALKRRFVRRMSMSTYRRRPSQ